MFPLKQALTFLFAFAAIAFLFKGLELSAYQALLYTPECHPCEDRCPVVCKTFVNLMMLAGDRTKMLMSAMTFYPKTELACERVCMGEDALFKVSNLVEYFSREPETQEL